MGSRKYSVATATRLKPLSPYQPPTEMNPAVLLGGENLQIIGMVVARIPVDVMNVKASRINYMPDLPFSH